MRVLSCARRGTGRASTNGDSAPLGGDSLPRRRPIVITTLRLVPTGLGRAGCLKGMKSSSNSLTRRSPVAGLHAVFGVCTSPAANSGNPNVAARLGTPAGPMVLYERVRPQCRIGDYLQSGLTHWVRRSPKRLRYGVNIAARHGARVIADESAPVICRSRHVAAFRVGSGGWSWSRWCRRQRLELAGSDVRSGDPVCRRGARLGPDQHVAPHGRINGRRTNIAAPWMVGRGNHLSAGEP